LNIFVRTVYDPKDGSFWYIEVYKNFGNNKLRLSRAEAKKVIDKLRKELDKK